MKRETRFKRHRVIDTGQGSIREDRGATLVRNRIVRTMPSWDLKGYSPKTWTWTHGTIIDYIWLWIWSKSSKSSQHDCHWDVRERLSINNVCSSHKDIRTMNMKKAANRSFCAPRKIYTAHKNMMVSKRWQNWHFKTAWERKRAYKGAVEPCVWTLYGSICLDMP